MIKRLSHAVLPDVIVAGAMKAGTTAFVDALSQLPGFTSGRIKEPAIFHPERTIVSLVARSIANYGFARGARIDGTTEYSKLPSTSQYAEAVMRRSPNARVLFLLRHPVDRALSHMRHDLERGRSIDSAIAVSGSASTYVRNSKYREMIAPWVLRNPPGVKLLVSEKVLEGDHDELGGLLDFLEIPRTTNMSFRSLNTSGTGRDVRGVKTLTTKLPGYHAVLRPLIPARLRGLAVAQLAKPLSPGVEAQLASVEEYRTCLATELAAEVKWYESGCPLDAVEPL